MTRSLNLLDPALCVDPYPIYAELREATPLAPVEPLGASKPGRQTLPACVALSL